MTEPLPAGAGWRLLARTAVAAALALLAAVAPGRARAAACDGATQAELTSCAEARRAAADKRLNEAYAQVVARLAGPDDQRQRDALREAERTWIGFRDAECRFEEAGSYGGSIHPMELADCAAGLSDARATTLARMAACHAQDGSCELGP